MRKISDSSIDTLRVNLFGTGSMLETSAPVLFETLREVAEHYKYDE